MSGLQSANTDSANRPSSSCTYSPTQVKGQGQCSGNVIFEKYFTGEVIDKKTWSHEIQIGGNDLVR